MRNEIFYTEHRVLQFILRQSHILLKHTKRLSAVTLAILLQLDGYFLKTKAPGGI